MANPDRERRKAEKRRRKEAHDREVRSRPGTPARTYVITAACSFALALVIVAIFLATWTRPGWLAHHLVRQVMAAVVALMVLYGGLNLYAAARERSRGRTSDER